jgi:hypothetical protein
MKMLPDFYKKILNQEDKHKDETENWWIKEAGKC